MKKAIYGLAASFDHPVIDADEQTVQISTIEPTTVQYFKNVALSVDHVPKQTITTTTNRENGELIIVQKGLQLFFKFIPTTKDGERIYRYVKQRKYRQCSYSVRIFKRTADEDTRKRTAWLLDEHDTVLKRHVGIYEICLTNNPANKETFCTTDGSHPMFADIDWDSNVDFLPIDAGDPWSEEISFSEMQQRLDALDEKIKTTLKRCKA